MTEVSQELPARMRRQGCTLFITLGYPLVKYILINDKKKYRGFTYIRKNLDNKIMRVEPLHDLYSDFYYKTGLQRIGINE